MTLKLQLSLFLSFAICLIPNSLQINSVSAQEITSDGTTGTTVTSDGNNYTIQDGTRNGSNLFHSFQDFSIPSGGSASFNNGNDISNILSRVTGGNISNIDGLIRANGSANLFLINPAGIMFGEGASLAIGGSFYGSTADSILFEDGEFSAVNNLDALILTINAPIGLNFRDNPSDIVNNSVANEGIGLTVLPDKTLALVGGNITFNSGVIDAPGANVKLASLASGGNVGIDGNSNLTLAEDITKADILLSDAATVDVASDGGGSITIEAGNVDLNQGSELISGIDEDLGVTNSQAGDITLNVSNAITLSGVSSIDNVVDSETEGNSGDINIVAGSIELTEGSDIGTTTFGEGNAGNVTIDVADTIAVDGEDPGDAETAGGIFSTVQDEAVGNAGSIEITTTNLNLTNGGVVSASTFAQGNAGMVTIDAADTISIDGVDNEGFSSTISGSVSSGGIGDAGGIEITTANLDLTNGGAVAANTFAQGNAGTVTIDAADTISIDGVDNEGFSSTISGSVNPGAVGNAGGIEITTANLNLTNGGTIGANTLAQGDAGNITINAADTISIDGVDPEDFPSSISSTVNSDAVGNGGGIEITTANFNLTNGCAINANTFGQGDAGNITINADNSLDIADGNIASAVLPTALGKGGQITLTGKSISLSEDASIDAVTFPNGENVEPEQVSGGDIELNVTDSLKITEDASLNSGTSGTGNAGNIVINGAGADIVIENNIPEGEENVESSVSGSIFSSSVNELGNTIGNAGDIAIIAKSLTLNDGGFISSNVAGGTGSGGDITISVAENLDIVDFNIISSATLDLSGEIIPIGNAGNITINADSLLFTGANFIITSTFGQGNAGDLTVNANNVSLSDNATLTSSTLGDGNSGEVQMTTNNLSLTGGSTVSASTFSEGNAGTVTIDASDNVSIDGIDQEGVASSIESNINAGAVGKAGGVNVTTPNLVISNGAGIFANTFGEGDGGDITLSISDRLTLKENSSISVQASETNANGGDITINAADGFVVAFPNDTDGDGSDIAAFSSGGAGGNITIEAQGIFGIEEGSATPGNNTNDIDASGDLDDGSVEIITPNSDAIQAANQLPSVPVVKAILFWLEESKLIRTAGLL
ncbi:MAG: filamentous hemagglutinin N-terminal domain-containing protein [Cyanobacteria bacterium P01_G01_bin.39]